MGYPTRIATCCYCGTRAALVLGRDRHELTCGTCGAPLHDLKRFRRDEADDVKRPQPAVRRRLPDHGRPEHVEYRRVEKRYRKRKSKGKKIMRSLIGEFLDVIEDILD